MRLHLRMLLFALLLVAFNAAGLAQKPAVIQEEGTTGLDSYPIPGSHLLYAKEQALNAYVAQHPELRRAAALKKTTAWTFSVGSAHAWWAYDYSTQLNYQTNSTCRAVGSHCIIFVEDSLWNTRVDQAAVQAIQTAFDSQTPADPTKGVYEMDVDTFGEPPNIDGDARVIILVLNIRDGWAGSGGYVAGYFYGINEIPGYPGGNDAEVYYLDANPGTLATTQGRDVALKTTAHEFQHMIHYAYDPGEISFFNEGCSLAAEVVCGYTINPQSPYVNETNHYLLDWRYDDHTAVLHDYSRAARFSIYLKDQFGTAVLKQIVSNTAHGIAGLNGGLATFGTVRRFTDILGDWFIANRLDDQGIDTKYGYLYQPSLLKAVGITYSDPAVPLTNGVIERLAASYLTFSGGSNLHITFNSSSPSLAVKAIEIGPSAKRVVSVGLGTEFAEPEFGTTYTEITFVVMNTSEESSASYSYSSSGVPGSGTELKWDTEPPFATLSLSANDTIAVTFDGMQGAHLDSIRVALKLAGSMTGGVWRVGQTNASLLGTPLAVPISAVGPVTPTRPFPVPYPNWAKVDLRAYSIDASVPFAVGFVCTGNSGSDNNVMVSKIAGSNPYHNFTYLQSNSGWFYLTATSNPDSIWIYHIRAYVSTGTNGVKESHELMPSTYSLAQNYPNPFNPSTTFEFSLPERSQVTLKVFDMLGEEVATLVNGEKEEGNYRVQWSPETLSSGTYIYRLQAGGRMESRKLILLK